jgi:AraC family transcriptional activator of mtrCDE
MGHLRQKLKVDPAQPRHLLTETAGGLSADELKGSRSKCPCARVANSVESTTRQQGSMRVNAMNARTALMSDMPNLETSQAEAAALDEFLRTLPFRCEVFFRGQVCDAWSLDTSGRGHVNFHVVCHGEGWFRLPGWPQAQHLSRGDVVVLPHDASHQLAWHEESPEAYGQNHIGREIAPDRGQPGTALVCGCVLIDRRAFRLLYEMLPASLIVRANSVESGALPGLVDLMFAQARARAIGASAVLERLAEAVMLEVLRCVASSHLHTFGLVAALCDRRIGRALVAMFAASGRDWTIDALAAEANLSRSAFVDRFHAMLGETPIAFLTAWRMQLAQRWLQNDRLSVAEVAERCGYPSGAAFAKAFRREVGAGPGQARRPPIA